MHMWQEIFLCVCVYPGHIVWTGKMRMDGIVITEWRYPHSVKLEKAGRKPPTGTAGKERVVVMVIGEFKQGFTNLQGKRCERCASEFFLYMCACVSGGLGCVYIFFFFVKEERKVAVTLMKTHKVSCFQFFYFQTCSESHLS